MGSKKNTATAAGLPALKIGCRVRRNDDLAEGRIVWANGVSVKIAWDDGEQVTWRRDSLASRPIEILADDEDQPAPAAPEPTQPAAPETPPAAPETAQESLASETPPFQPTTAETPPTAAPSAQEPPATTLPASEPIPVDPLPADPGAQVTVPTETSGGANERKRRRAPKAASAAAKKEQDKKMSALDAAAQVLAETGAPMSCKELIGAMAGKGYWTSPGGKTPDATLCSAILREIKVKAEQSRFLKVGPGRFARRSA